MSINIHKVPGVYIIGVMGDFGVGKTLSLVQQGLKIANHRKRRIVANFSCNYKYLKEYCKIKGYNQINWRHIEIRNDQDLLKLVSCINAIILLDEAGLEMFSRNFKNQSRSDVLHEMFQIRKSKSMIMYSCQYIDQVDKQMKDNTQLWIYCKGFQENEVLYSRTQLAYDRNDFKRFTENPEKMSKIIWPIFLAKFRVSYSWLIVGRIIGLIKHCKKACKFAGEYTREKKQRFNLFYELEGISKYFEKVDYLSEEDILFKVYNSFEKVHQRKNKLPFNEEWNKKDYGPKEDTPKPENGQVKTNTEMEWLKQL
jgi:hypothetical protein